MYWLFDVVAIFVSASTDSVLLTRDNHSSMSADSCSVIVTMDWQQIQVCENLIIKTVYIFTQRFPPRTLLCLREISSLPAGCRSIVF